MPVEDTSMLASRDSTRRRSCEQTLVGDRAIGGIGRELSQPLTSVPLVGPQSEKLGKHERRLDRLRNAGTGEVGRIATVFEEVNLSESVCMPRVRTCTHEYPGCFLAEIITALAVC